MTNEKTYRAAPTRYRTAITRTILQWYAENGRHLPWRSITDPYRVLVSEIMLQQTTVQRVLLKYPLFLKRFPTLRKLAAARQRDVVMAWQGMGYNNRAVRLHRLARGVMNVHGGRIPHTCASLLSLPGIGPYTANAILSSAFGKEVPIVDVNIQRVLSRILWKLRTTSELRPQKEIWQAAAYMLPEGNAHRWNQALMDLGATVCTAFAPGCERCPVAKWCASQAVMEKRATPTGRQARGAAVIPNRIYRGRIIEALRRHHARRGLHLDEVGKAIHPSYSRAQRKWLDSLLSGLERDGLIKRARAAKWNEGRVSLA